MTGPFQAAAAEAKAEPLHLEALGRRFALGPGPDAITWLELSATAGQNRYSGPAARAWLAFARSCFTETSWSLFRAAVVEAHLEYDELEALIGEAIEIIEGRPTTPSSHSDSGSSTTTPASTETSTAEPPVAAAS